LFACETNEFEVLILGCSAIHIDPEARHKSEGINTPQKKEKKSSEKRERGVFILNTQIILRHQILLFFLFFFSHQYIDRSSDHTLVKKESLVTTNPRISYYTTFNSLPVLSLSLHKLKGIQNVSNITNKCYILSLKTHAQDYHS